MAELNQRRKQPADAHAAAEALSHDQAPAGSGSADKRHGLGRQWRQGMPCAPAAAAALLASLAILAAVALLARLLPGAGRGKGSLHQAGLFTAEQLARYDGSRGNKLVYLAVMGEVFDVSPGARHYGPGGGYSRFAGRDASRSYVTGRFATDAHDDVADLSGEQMAELVRWRDFYVNHKEYNRVGWVVGRFYDAKGAATPLQQTVQAAAAAHTAAVAAAEAAKAAGAAAFEGQGGEQAPQPDPCNVKWTKAEGGSVYCPAGKFPRRVIRPDWQGQPQEQCACLASSDVSGTARLYEGCSEEAASCRTSPPQRPRASAG
ncbi:Membrane-associated progesterone-binding protein 4 [Chlorella vulgaris]